MGFDIDPQGRHSFVKITSKEHLGDGSLQLQCFENFCEYGLAAEVYDWTVADGTASYSIITSGVRKGKVRLDMSVRPVGDGIALDTAVTNLGAHSVDHLLYNTCLKFCNAGPAFADTEGERTFVLVDDEWTPVASLPLRVQPKKGRRMQNFFVKGHEPETNDGFYGIWGLCPTPLSRAMMAKQTSESPLAIGIEWDRAFYARSNMNSSHFCIHSQAVLDDIGPGETRKRFGRIFFAPDGLNQLYEKAKACFGWKV